MSDINQIELFENILRMAIGETVLAKTGFNNVKDATLLKHLRNVTPSGSTALRDSIQYGISKMIDLRDILGKLNYRKSWNFVQIILTDGEDNSSKTTLEELAIKFLLISKIFEKSEFMTYLIGVDINIDSQAFKDLLALKLLGGENIEVFGATSSNLKSIFERIKVSIL